MKKFLAILMMLTLAISLFAGCGSKPAEPAGDQTGDKTGEKTEAVNKALKVSMVTDEGGVNDQSFNQSAWEGLSKAKEDLGVEAGYLESQQEADYATNLETALDQENDLIWAIGYQMEKSFFEAADNNPDQKYAIIDIANTDARKNVVGVSFKEQEPSFLVGYIAGKMTTTNKVGFVGGQEGPIIAKFEYGYMAGVKMANPDCEVVSQYANSYTDAAKGKSIAENMFLGGVDIIFHASGATGNGVIEAAKEKGKYAIGVDRDQSSLAPDNVITSALKRVDNAIYLTTKKLKEGNYEGGTTITYGLAEGGVDFVQSKMIPQETVDEVNKLKEDIISGKIVVPSTKEEFKNFGK